MKNSLQQKETKDYLSQKQIVNYMEQNENRKDSGK